MTMLMRRRWFRTTLLWAIVGLLIGGSPATMSAAPLVLGAQNFYRMVAKPLAGGGGLVPNPLADVSLNPCPLPPGGTNSDTFLDLTDPGSPHYMQPEVGETFTEINWGMNLGFAGVAFSLPSPEPGELLDDFSVLMQGTNEDGALVGHQFRLDFQIEGPHPGDPGELVSLNPCPLPPGSLFAEPPFGGDPAMQGAFNLRFRFPSVGDPSLFFQLFNITTGQQYGFSAVPEPGTLLLVGCGVLAAFGWRRRRQGV